MEIEFLKKAEVNKIWYKKGDTLKVSPSIYKRLKEEKSIKDYIPKKVKKDEEVE